jgi:hypothetical protein
VRVRPNRGRRTVGTDGMAMMAHTLIIARG